MNPMIHDRCRNQSRVFKALGHPTRLFIVQELGAGERCVCELQEMIGDDMSTVSKHLSVLREAGLVRDDRRRNQVFYHLAARCVLDFMDCVENLLAAGAPQQIQPEIPGDRT